MLGSQYVVEWYIPKRVIVAQFWGEPSTEKLIEGIKATNALLETALPSAELIHLILDIRGVNKMLPLREIPKVIQSMEFNTNTGWMIVIDNSNQLIRFSMSIAQQMLRLRGRSVQTPEEALDILHKGDDSLNWSQANPDAFKRSFPTTL
jgi:hypothetical protein